MADSGKTILNMSARVFVANVPSDKIDSAQMKVRMEKYGKVLDVYVAKTFAFVQFESDSAAAAAIKGETGTFIAENKIECSLARKQPKSARPQEQQSGMQNYSGGAAGYGPPGARGRERSPLRGGYGDRFDPRGMAGPYHREDPYFSERFLGGEEAALHDPLQDPRGRPRTPEYIRDIERNHIIQRRQLEDNEAFHVERMRTLKEEHKLKMEILELEKQYLELKVYKQAQAIDPSASHPRQEQAAPASSMASSQYAYTPLTSSTPYKPANHSTPPPPRAGGLRPPSLMSNPPNMNSLNSMTAAMYGRR